MYINHELINTLNAHIVHINLNTTFYTYVEDSPTKTIYIRHYLETHTHTHTHARTLTHTHARTHAHTHARTHTHTHTDCSRNWVLILFWGGNTVSLALKDDRVDSV